MEHIFSPLVASYKRLTHQTRGIYRKKGIRPGMDWEIILVTFTLCLVGVAGVHIFIYMGVKNSSWWKTEEVDTVYQVKIDKKLLTDALARFDQQKKGMEALKTNPSILKDPSL